MGWIKKCMAKIGDFIENNISFVKSLWLVVLMYVFSWTIWLCFSCESIGYFTISNIVIWGSLFFMQLARVMRDEHGESRVVIDSPIMSHLRDITNIYRDLYYKEAKESARLREALKKESK